MLQMGCRKGDGLAGGTRAVSSGGTRIASFCTSCLITTPAASRSASGYVDDLSGVFGINVKTNKDKQYHDLSPHHIRDLAQRALSPSLRAVLCILFVDTVQIVNTGIQKST